MKFPLLADRIFERPLLIEQRKFNAILGALGPRLEFDLPAGTDTPKPRAMDDDDEYTGGSAPWTSYVVDRGIARIKIVGTLVHRSSWMDSICGLVSYEELTATFRRAIADDNVKAILFEFDSGGGEVDGLFDLVDEIYEARGPKPIVAVAKDCAASAAYLIAAAADRVVITQMADVGSVGVIAALTEYSKQNEMLGVAVTYIFAGDRKVDGWPDIPLSDEAKARFQADVDKLYGLFVEKVALFRGMAAGDVVATQALLYRGADGVTVGFADEVSTLDDALDALAAQAQPGAPSPFGPAVGVDSNADPSGDRRMSNVDMTAIRQQAATEAAARIRAILGCAEAEGREEMARSIALETDLSADQARTLLAKTPKAAVVDRLDVAMRAAGNPNVGVGAAAVGGGDEAAEADAIAASIMATFRGTDPRSASR